MFRPAVVPDVRLDRAFLSATEADALFRALRDTVPWRQDTIRVFGKDHPIPRLQAGFGDAGLTYVYSGIAMAPMPWLPALDEVRRRVDVVTGASFNTVLLNLYRDGQDTVSWHADDEPELGPSPTIASVSLGAERDFVLRHKTRREVDDVTYSLPHGSLLIMRGNTQAEWMHSLPRRKGVTRERINLTFRRIVA